MYTHCLDCYCFTIFCIYETFSKTNRKCEFKNIKRPAIAVKYNGSTVPVVGMAVLLVRKWRKPTDIFSKMEILTDHFRTMWAMMRVCLTTSCPGKKWTLAEFEKTIVFHSYSLENSKQILNFTKSSNEFSDFLTFLGFSKIFRFQKFFIFLIFLEHCFEEFF